MCDGRAERRRTPPVTLTRRGGRSKGVAPIAETSARSHLVAMRTITIGSGVNRAISRCESAVVHAMADTVVSILHPAGRQAGKISLRAEESGGQVDNAHLCAAVGKDAGGPAVVLTCGDSTGHDKFACRLLQIDTVAEFRAHLWITRRSIGDGPIAIVTPTVQVAGDTDLAIAVAVRRAIKDARGRSAPRHCANRHKGHLRPGERLSVSVSSLTERKFR